MAPGGGARERGAMKMRQLRRLTLVAFGLLLAASADRRFRLGRRRLSLSALLL